MEMPAVKVNLIWVVMKYHGTHSGYHQLCRYFGVEKFHSTDDHWSSHRLILLRLGSRLIDAFLWRTSGMPFYRRRRFFAECHAIPKIMTRRREVFHFIYGENSYRYSGLVPRLRGSRIICTYHVPPDEFQRRVGLTNHVRRLDAIVVVASNQIEFFAQFIPRERIFLVPHGIDTEFFQPYGRERNADDNKNCLFVGNHLRDFRALREVIQNVNLRRPQTEFVIVTWEQNFAYFEGVRNVVLASNLSDEDLLRYYQSSSLFLQPLENSTANNSVLESLACGLPVVVTDVGGIRDYVDETCAILVPPKNPELMAEEVISLLEDESRLQKMSDSSRKRALEFSWPKIAEKMEKVYEKVLNQ